MLVRSKVSATVMLWEAGWYRGIISVPQFMRGGFLFVRKYLSTTLSRKRQDVTMLRQKKFGGKTYETTFGYFMRQ